MPTLKELSVLYAKKQPKQVENITQEAPILSIIPFEEASHDLWNVYEEVTEVNGPAFVNMDAELGTVSVKSELKKKDLSIMGGIAEVGEDKARMFGGAPAYFAKQEPSILRKAGMTTEIAILYNNFKPYAVDNSKVLDASGSSNKNDTIFAVRFVPGETMGLYSPKGFGNGAILDVSPINGGSLYKVSVTRNGSTESILGYGVRYKGYFGLQLANVDTVAIIKNVDRKSSTRKLPTAIQMDDLLAMVHAGNSNTYLFMHPSVKTALGSLKDTKLTMTPADGNYSTMIERWGGVPIVTSYNFKDGNEANA